MKVLKKLFIIHFALTITSCSPSVYIFTSFHEPADEGLRLLWSDDGKNWSDCNQIFLKPTVGNQKVMRDPSIAQGRDGTFHLVWTSSWRGDAGFGYANSKDLLHWSEQRFIPVMAHEPTVVNVWAPEIFYDDKADRFVIIWASTIPFRFEKGIEDENNNHRMYYTTTTDFQSFSPTKLFIDPKFSIIDAVIAKRKKDDYVLVLKDNTRPNRNLKVAFGDSPTGPFTNISEPFSEKFTEGPSVQKIKNEWYIYFDAYQDKKYKTIKTTDFQAFKDVSSEVFFPEGHKHGTVLKVRRRILNHLLK